MRTLILILLTITFTYAGDSLIDRRLRDAVMAMAANQVPGAPSPLERGTRLLVMDGAMEDHFDEVMKSFAEVFNALGTPQVVEEIAVRPYGSRSEIAYFAVLCQRGVAFVRITSFKRGDNQRIVSSVSVGARPELVFPPGLLEPEASKR